MTNEDIKQELDFIHESIKDLTVLTDDESVKRFVILLDEKFDYVKDETNLALNIYESKLKRILN